MNSDLEQLAKNLEWRFQRQPNEQVTTTELKNLTQETAELSRNQIRAIMEFYAEKYEDVRLSTTPNLILTGMRVLQENELLKSVEIIIVNGGLFEDVAHEPALKCPVRLSVLGSAMANATIGLVEETVVLIIR